MPSTERQRPLCILVVEDSEADFYVLTRSLARSFGDRLDHHIRHATSAEQALEILERDSKRIDVVLSDHRLAGLSGLELCQETVRRGHDVATVLITGMGSEELAARALASGIDEYLIKDSASGYLTLVGPVIEDVANRLHLRREHQRQRQRADHLAALVDSSHVAIIGCDLDANVVSWNPAAEVLFGWHATHAVGSRLDGLIGASMDEVQRLLDRQSEAPGGQRGRPYETTLVNADGAPVAVGIALSPILATDAAEHPIERVGVSLIVRDLTASRRTESELRRAQRDLDSSLEGVVEHLAPPVRGALGLLEALRREPDTADLDIFVSRLEAELGNAEALLEGLRALVRADAASAAAQVVDTLAAAENALAGLLDDRPGTARFTIARDLPVCWGDPRAIESVFRRLAHNALQHADPSTPVRVDIGWQRDPEMDGGQAASHVTLWVRDDGPGIPRGDQGRIFELFYRRPAETTTTGLGLPLVKRLVVAGGGRLWLESTLGHGSTFLFTVPRPPGEP